MYRNLCSARFDAVPFGRIYKSSTTYPAWIGDVQEKQSQIGCSKFFDIHVRTTINVFEIRKGFV